ncbi:hypothetical protein CSOJ01_07349 [Colletotrichum sojae]|uniref:Clr5 domain-containing protein n=1 Tax=Colletotrichum sojae TaxID=2175907 RepID=A0A8H6J9T2_9PEZI|nr:hypothetical protein CSOJ01_07349 [Colletotrichum sojae]
MFIQEGKSLLEIRRRLEEDGFPVTKAQLEYKLKIWEFRKKAPKKSGEALWQYVGHRVTKRKQKGKESDVMLNRQLIGPSKLAKEVNRHQLTSVARFNPCEYYACPWFWQHVHSTDSVKAAASPKTPQGLDISICTPAAIPMKFSWPETLPWLLFQPKLQHGKFLACEKPV